MVKTALLREVVPGFWGSANALGPALGGQHGDSLAITFTHHLLHVEHPEAIFYASF